MSASPTVQAPGAPGRALPRRHSAETPARSSWRTAFAEYGLVGLAFFVLGCALTWPLVGRMSSGFYGFGNDNFGGIWFSHWIHRAFWGPEKTTFSPEMSVPRGYEIDDRFIQAFDRALAIVFGGIKNGLFAYNLEVLISFPLAGVAMYALAKYLSGSRLAAVLAGVVFVASPFHLAMSMQYPAMASIHVVPLLILALLVALRSRRLRDAALFGAAMALVWITSYYYGWFAIWFVAVVILAAALRGLWRGVRKRRLGSTLRDGAVFAVTRGAVSVGTFAVLALPVLISLAVRVAGNEESYARTKEDLIFTAVRPWQYLLPPHDSPIFGELTSDVIQRHTGILPVYEQSTYLGLVPVLLALAALILVRRIPPAARVALPLLLVGAVVCAFMTLGPILPWNMFSIATWLKPDGYPHFAGPSSYLFDLSPVFRYYGRAFVFSSAVLAGLAAVGLAMLLPRLARIRSWAPVAVTVVLTGLILLEFINFPPERFVDLRTPPWVAAVEKLPDDKSIVQYPIAGYSSPRSLFYVYWQTRHDQPTVNPAEEAQTEALLQAVSDPESYVAGERLHREGIDFAVVHTKLPDPTFPPYQPHISNDSLPPDTGRRNPWFEPYARTSDAVIYRVRPRPRFISPAVAAFGEGFGDLEIDKAGRWRWLLEPRGVINVALRTKGRATVSFRATSFFVPRKTEFLVDGRRIATRTIQPDMLTQVRLPLELSGGVHRLEVRTNPGPLDVNTVLKNGDLRDISLRVEQPRITARLEK